LREREPSVARECGLTRAHPPQGAPPARRRHADLAISLALGAAAAAAFLDVLSLGFTGIDSYPTILAARAETLADVGRVITSELRGGIEPTIKYYRPLTLLTYTLDHAFWGWSPLGYHLTDLLLHAVAVATVYWMARTAFAHGAVAATCVALVFMFHPSALETIPAITRRQEPLMVIGMSLVVMGAGRAPARRWWAAVVAGSLMAVCAAERGLVVPAFAFAFAFCLAAAGLPRKARLFHALRVSSPSLVVALGFFALRHVLVGSEAIHFSAGNLVRLPALASLQLVYPQQLIDLAPPSTTVGTICYGLAGLGLIAGVLWMVLRSTERGLHRYALLSTAAYIALFSVAGQANPWYAYTAAPALSLSLVALVREGLRRRSAPGFARLGGLALAGVAAAVVCGFVATAPLFQRYPAWSRSAEMAEQVWDFLAAQDRTLPPQVAIALVNVPITYRESEASARVTFSATVLMQHAVDAWRAVHGVSRPVILAGLSNQVRDIEVPLIHFTDSATVRVYFPPGDPRWYEALPPLRGRTLQPHLGRGVELPWPPLPSGRAFVTFVFGASGFEQLQAPGAHAGE
jgi:hypothetical protein